MSSSFVKACIFAAIVLASTTGIRPVTVLDSIEMTRYGSVVGNPPDADYAPARFSPDGKTFVVLVNRGDLENNTDVFSLLLFHSSDAFVGEKPQTILTMASSSNQPAIDEVRWTPDGRRLLFLGHRLSAHQELYSFDVQSRALTQLTHHPTDLTTFDVTQDMGTIAYIAQAPVLSLFNEASRRNGILVSEQSLVDLITGKNTQAVFEPEVFITYRGGRTIRVTLPSGATPLPGADIILSPNGKLAALPVFQFGHVSGFWSQYAIPAAANKSSLLIINTQTGVVQRPVNAPTLFCLGSSPCINWSPDGRSLVIAGTYLPLTVSDPAERTRRKDTAWVVEVNLRNGTIQKIMQAPPGLESDTVTWDARRNILFIQQPPVPGDRGVSAASASSPISAFRKIDGRWQLLPLVHATPSAESFDVHLQQGINLPPRLIAVNHATQRTALLMDLNPQFRHLQFGHVEQITWTARDGVTTTGGLYLPVGYVAGRRYPLVIQTHGWDGRAFSIDGYSTSGYAAQALAGRGIMVAQIPVGLTDSSDYLPGEGARVVAMFEGLIDTLDHRGLIDRSRVGLQAWSISGYIRFFLAFSKYPIKAASFYDTTEFGYFEYMTLNPDMPEEAAFAADFERTFGAIPVGSGLQAWIEHSPVFNLDKVHTPVREVAPAATFLSDSWETYVALKHLGNPVELVILPDALHAPVKPWERVVAQQGNVDWFRFWLQGYVDPSPAKAAQYRRWEAMRRH